MYLPITKLSKELGIKYSEIRDILIRKGYLIKDYPTEKYIVSYKNGIGSNVIYDNGNIKKITPKFKIEDVWNIIQNKI